MPDHLDGKRIEFHDTTFVRKKLPIASGLACQPGGITTVDHASSMIAGPLTASCIDARSTIRVVTSQAPSNEQMRELADNLRTAVVGRSTMVVAGCRACTRTDSIPKSPAAPYPKSRRSQHREP